MIDPATDIAHKVGESVQHFGGFLQCLQCGTRQELGDTGEYTANGWPTCCGYTMRWWTQRQLDAGLVPPTAAGCRAYNSRNDDGDMSDGGRTRAEVLEAPESDAEMNYAGFRETYDRG